MADTAEVLARPEVQKAIADMIAAACISYGVKPSHAKEIAARFVIPVRLGSPVTSAIDLVDAILKDARAGALEEAANLFTFGNRPHACLSGDCPHDGWSQCVDAIRDEITALYRPTPATENDGAGEAGGLLNA